MDFQEGALKRRLIAFILGGVIGSGLIMGCGDFVATDTFGEFVPNVEGTYDQASVTAACANEFDTTIEVAQTQKNLILQASNSGFSNYNGTIDEEGVLTLSGAFSDGSASECSGTFISGVISVLCESDSVSCSVIYQSRGQT